MIKAGTSTLLPFLSLILILVLIILFYYFLKSERGKVFKNDKIKEITRYYYSPKSYISIIEIEGELYMLGITDNNISKLDKIDKEEVVKNLLSSDNGKKKSFMELLAANKGNKMNLFSRFKEKAGVDDHEKV